ncbi:MAG: hypothetical protein ACLQPD_15280 [Desulfomonilaceae bacterium]
MGPLVLLALLCIISAFDPIPDRGSRPGAYIGDVLEEGEDVEADEELLKPK